MKRVRLVAIDLDGTLLDTNGRLEATQVEACRAASSACAIVIATGRRPRKARRLLDLFDFEHYIISCSGGVTEHRHSNRRVQTVCFDASSVSILVDAFSRFGVPALLSCCDGPNEEILVAGGPEAGRYFTGYLAGNASSRFRRVEHDQPVDANVNLVSAIGPVEELEKLQHLIASEFPGSFSLQLVRHLSVPGAALDILPAGVSKWTALQTVSAELGLASDEIAAIGDDMNDLEMLRNAGVAIAMANARPEILAVAHHVTKSCDNGGVAYALKELLSLT